MKQILLFASLLVILASCNKSSISAVENDTILREGKWKISGYTVKFVYSGKDSVYDIYKKMDTCRMDDYITFEDNHTGIQFSGTKTCGSELKEMPFQWELRDNQSVLVMNNAQYTIGNVDKIPVTPVGKEYVEAKIKKINKQSMTLTYETTVKVLVGPIPPATEGTFQEVTFYFTQTFDRM